MRRKIKKNLWDQGSCTPTPSPYPASPDVNNAESWRVKDLEGMKESGLKRY